MNYPVLSVVVVTLILGGVPSGVGANAPSGQATNPCVGTISDPPDGVTLITIQGARFKDGESLKTPGLLVSVGPRGEIVGVLNNSAAHRWWTYDVDPLPNGNLLQVTTQFGISVIEEIDPRTGSRVWVTRLHNVKDAHDVDYLGAHEYLLVDKGERRDRVLVYNRRTEEIVWQWLFADRYPKRGGGPYPDDWTHVNDADEIDDDRYLVSVRNFDQVIVINRTSDEIEVQLGSDDNYGTLFEQHNPQYLADELGPSILVADSRNDRVVEYTRTSSGWEQTWELTGGGLHEPRDADRLPNGNTLVVDRLGHRTLEVAPNGTVLWEFYSPWQPYDAERYRFGDEPDGPTMRELGVTGEFELTGSTRFTEAEIERCSATLTNYRGNGTLVPPNEYGQYAPGVHGPDDPLSTSTRNRTYRTDTTAVMFGGVVGVIVVLAATVYSRRRSHW